jgi:hypothetical protein
MQSYLVNCDYMKPRNGNYERHNQISNKWAPSDNEVDLHGNLAMHFRLNAETLEVSFTKDYNRDIFICQSIPSALLLYRLLCSFECKVKTAGPEGYKSVWSVQLLHKSTHEYLEFGDHKGGLTFWTRFIDAKSAPNEFIEDLKELMNYLYSDECAHPYDGVTAGSVA